MRYYHYCIDNGSNILKEQILKPSSEYSKSNTGPVGPELLFLTRDDNWCKTVAYCHEGEIIREPDELVKLNIACWRFEVEVPEEIPCLMYPLPWWIPMLEDGIEKGEDIKNWTWTENALPVQNSYIRKSASWVKL